VDTTYCGGSSRAKSTADLKSPGDASYDLRVNPSS
jgi:hypothetical protein